MLHMSINAAMPSFPGLGHHMEGHSWFYWNFPGQNLHDSAPEEHPPIPNATSKEMEPVEMASTFK